MRKKILIYMVKKTKISMVRKNSKVRSSFDSLESCKLVVNMGVSSRFIFADQNRARSMFLEFLQTVEGVYFDVCRQSLRCNLRPSKQSAFYVGRRFLRNIYPDYLPF